MTLRRLSVRSTLDDWFPTLARYAGLGLLVYSIVFDRLRNPALLTIAGGLMFLKSVVGGSGDR